MVASSAPASTSRWRRFFTARSLPKAIRDPGSGIGILSLSLIAVLVGALTGVVAILFRHLIVLIDNAFFLGSLSLEEPAGQLIAPGPWGAGIILVPVLGGLGVVFLIRNFAPEARGGGVPEVMDAIYYREGRIRPKVAVVKSLASALSIGSGASVGQEGPIIQIGSAFGSSVAQALGLLAWQRITLLACGAGAGIAATFNTPLGGVMFAIELMMPEVSARTFLPVVLATGTATYVGRLFYGAEPLFLVAFSALPETEPLDVARLAGFVGVGVLCGLGAYAFVRVLALFDRLFAQLSGGGYLQHALGMALVGAMMYLLAQTYGYYLIEGTGHATIQAILTGEIAALTMLAVLFVAKLVATVLSLSSGAAGGIFSPSLLLGAALGGALAAGLDCLWPEAGFTVPEFAIVGMAAMIGGATGAAMTAIVTIFELTRDYNVIVPMILATALAIGIRRAFSAESMYTIKLAARGHYIPKERHTNMFLVRHADEVMDTAIAYLPASLDRISALRMIDAMASPPRFILLHQGNRMVGVTSHQLLTGPGGADDQNAAIPALRYIIVGPGDLLNDVMQCLAHEEAEVALVAKSRGQLRVGEVEGLISPDDVGQEVLRSFQSRGQ